MRNMEFVTRNPLNKPAAKKQRSRILIALLVVVLLHLIFSSVINWGYVTAMAVFWGIFVAGGSTRVENPYRICVGQAAISVEKGPYFLWGAAIEELDGIDVAEVSKELGVVFAPKRVVIKKRDGDFFSIPFDEFEEGDLQALIGEAHRLIGRA